MSQETTPQTTTNASLTAACELDPTTYPKGIKVSDTEMATRHILPAMISHRNGTTLSRLQQDIARLFCGNSLPVTITKAPGVVIHATKT